MSLAMVLIRYHSSICQIVNIKQKQFIPVTKKLFFQKKTTTSKSQTILQRSEQLLFQMNNNKKGY